MMAKDGYSKFLWTAVIQNTKYFNVALAILPKNKCIFLWCFAYLVVPLQNIEKEVNYEYD